MTTRTATEVFPPGEFIREELDARGWTQGDLAEIMDRPIETVNKVISGKRSITPETANGLAAALGTSAELWLNLENAYRLSLVRKTDDDVGRRSRIYSVAPVKDMLRRGWIEPSRNVDVLERQIVEFFELKSINDEPKLQAAARKSTSDTETNPSQKAWFFRAKRLAKAIQVKAFRSNRLQKVIQQLRNLAVHPQEVRNVPRVLADAGIRFLIIEHLPKTRIDGAAFWLNQTSPVVVLSLRYDRIDCFWHTLFHELAHIHYADSLSLDSDLVGIGVKSRDDQPKKEQRADEFACNALIPADQLEDFVVRVGPLFSKKKIIGFARRIGVHPGIVVGQLQYRREISYAHSREMLAKVRDMITDAALTDGWGHSVAI